MVPVAIAPGLHTFAPRAVHVAPLTPMTSNVHILGKQPLHRGDTADRFVDNGGGDSSCIAGGGGGGGGHGKGRLRGPRWLVDCGGGRR